MVEPRQKEDTKSSRRVTTPSIALRVQLDGAICDVVCPPMTFAYISYLAQTSLVDVVWSPAPRDDVGG
jgi:hypothetical protein